MTIKKTTSDNSDFQLLATELELELKIRDGDDYLQYAYFNRTDSPMYAIVAYLLDEPIGCGAFRSYEADTIEVKRMYVRPAHRGKRVASKILQELENWGAALGFGRCVLETGKNQPEAIALYQKCGYEIIPNFGRYVNCENSVCFKKILL